MKTLAERHKYWTNNLKAAKTIKDADICRQKLSEIQKAMANQNDVFQNAEIEEEKIDLKILENELKKKETDLEKCKEILKYKSDLDVNKLAYEINSQIEVLEAKIKKAKQMDFRKNSVVKYQTADGEFFFYDRALNELKFESGAYFSNAELEHLNKTKANSITFEILKKIKTCFNAEPILLAE